MDPKTLLTCAACIFIIALSGVDSTIYRRKVEKQILDSILQATGYDPRIRPAGVNGTIEKPLDVNVNLYIENIYHIDDENMMYSVDMIFREDWVDERLRFSQNPGVDYVTLDDDEVIWTPDLFFSEYKGYNHDLTRPNILLRIYPNGTVFLSKRYNLVLFCHMDLTMMPFDRQICNIRIASYAWKMEDMALTWKEPVEDTVGISKSLHMQFFTLEKFWATQGVLKVSSGGYPFLMLSLQLQRKINYYLIQVYIPCMMLVIASYAAFWIKARQFTARIVLSVATLYTLAQIVFNINLEMPKVSYTTAMNWYTGISLTFVFFAFVESILVYVLESRKDDSPDEAKTNSNGDIGTDDNTLVHRGRLWLMRKSNNCIDATALILYPALYACFLIIYWATCLIISC